MMPIPKHVLCHSAVLTVSYNADLWDKAGGSEASPLENVRIEPSMRVVKTVSQTEITLTARLFFDAVNSSCGLPFLLPGDKYNDSTVMGETVTFNGRTYTVETISPMYDARKLHHYEVGLSGG